MSKNVKNNSKNNQKDKNKLVILLIILVLFLILIIGGSYAWLTVTKTSSKQNVIKAGDISMKLDESLSDGINISHAYPMTDEEGKNQTTIYKFKITNDGDTNNSYIVYLGDEKIEEGKIRMKDSNVKYRLLKDDDNETIDFISNLATETLTYKDEDKEYRKLDSGTLNVDEEITYTLQVWMDYDAGNDAQGTVFNKKLRIESAQIVE